ncbi:TetR/AcrR family transcriptional regulator [Rhodopseudomonas sp. P2A-2r]|uniref:TetR/AcrR family transcriptional regulator n=1 Tax=unclassified Rhodopseudomonas TaxID=2638247 RepID=UPI002234AFAF|nr:TetR/AcrR family transcriptional regulator [Rhodopseudomonas sp. P2A-2r]UZE46932.1 TetR/AcrR family transcriptional regulator [Rhodopseudomonas sp. P2A-2r]
MHDTPVSEASDQGYAVKAQSTKLRAGAGKKAATKLAKRGKPEQVRMSPQDRRRQILDEAADFFSQFGLTAQTRGLAAACGISQRLLYRYFPTKEALLDEVYKSAIAGPFKAVWFAELADRTIPLETRLTVFYRDYFATIFTSRWLRLFMYASLADIGMAPNYTSTVVIQLLETIMAEAAHEQSIKLPADKDLLHEIAWTLHGALSHYAIRRHLYRFDQSVPEESVVAIHIAQFLGGFRAAVAAAGQKPA